MTNVVFKICIYWSNNLNIKSNREWRRLQLPKSGVRLPPRPLIGLQNLVKGWVANDFMGIHDSRDEGADL